MKKTIGLLLVFSLFSCALFSSFTPSVKANSNSDFASTIEAELDKIDLSYSEEEYYSLYYEASSEILSLPTKELLEYFLNSLTAVDWMFSSNPIEIQEVDYSGNKVYEELITRKDLAEAVIEYKTNVLQEAKNNALIYKTYELFIKNSEVASVLNRQLSTENDFSNLLRSESTSSRAAITDLTIMIEYNYHDTIQTINGYDITLLRAGRELTAEEKTYINNNTASFNNVQLSQPSAYYNCHSFAWYRSSSTNPYWIDSVYNYTYDEACLQISSQNVQVGDIIVYYNANGLILHSGIVVSLNNSNYIICSKWGIAGAYFHSIQNVPNGYKCYDGSIIVEYYRYHDYERIYIGNNYHSGARHFYEYADSCKICKIQTNNSWTAVLCQGPPCVLVASEQSFKLRKQYKSP